MPLDALPSRAPGFDRGALQIARLPGAPWRLHWSYPVALYLLAGARWSLGFALGFTALVLVRLAAQAATVRRLGGRVTALRIHALGGDVCWQGETQPLQRSWVALAGALGVFLVAWGARSALAARGMPAGEPWASAVTALTAGARVLLAVHLLPFWPLDGYDLWRTPLRALERWAVDLERQRIAQSRATAPPDEMHEVEPEVAAAKAALARAWQEARKPPPA